MDYDRPCHISADVTSNVTLNVTTNIIITSGGNGGILIITFLILERGGHYDCIIGAVADNNIPSIRQHIAKGVITYEDAIKQIMQKTMGNQYAFLTKKAIATLKIKELIK